MSRTSSKPSPWERWQQAQAREAERQQRLAAAAAREREYRQRQDRIAARKAEAAARTATLAARVRDLRAILATGLDRPAQLDLGSLRQVPRPPRFDPGALATPAPRPVWERYAPAHAAGLAERVRRPVRYRRERSVAYHAYLRARYGWEQAERDREQRLAAARRAHAERVAALEREAAGHNRWVDRLAAGVLARDPEWVGHYLGMVLARLPLPPDLPLDAEVRHQPEREQAAVRLMLPGRGLVPAAAGYRYLPSRDELRPVPRAAGETAQLHRAVVAQVSLLAIRNLFETDPPLASVVLTARVDGAGRLPARETTVAVTRERFAALTLDPVRPEACLASLDETDGRGGGSGGVGDDGRLALTGFR